MKRNKEYFDINLKTEDIKNLRKGNTVVRAITINGITWGLSIKSANKKIERKMLKLQNELRELKRKIN